MKHILNDLTEQEKNSIREQHTGGMKVMTESFAKLVNSKLGDVKPILAEQDIIGMANQILTGFGDSDKKVKEFCDLCKKSKAQPHPRANRFADVIRNAVQGAGTNEESIYHVFDSLAQQANDGEKFDEFCSLVKAYQQSYNVDLHTDLSSDISDESEWVRIMRPIRDLLVADRMSSDDARPSNQTTSMPTRPSVTPFPTSGITKEQITGTDTSDVVVDCFKTHFESPNMELPKSCKELAKEIKDSKQLPLDITKYGPCTSDLSKSTGDSIFTTMGKLKDVGKCIIKKTSSPVKI